MVLAAAEHQRSEGMLREVDPRGLLPPRLRQTLLLAAQGWKYGRIAEHLNHSEAPVKSYLHDAYQLLGVSGRDELMRCRRG